MNTFSAGAMVSAGWRTFTKRGWFFVGAFLLAIAIESAANGALSELGKIGAMVDLFTFLANIVVSTLYGMGITNFALKAQENSDTVALRDLWHPEPFWRFLGVSLLTGLCVLAALILAAIGGGIIAGLVYLTASSAALVTFFIVFGVAGVVLAVTIAVALLFAKYLVIARPLGPVEALKESVRITKGHRLELLLLLFLLLLVNILGAVCLLVGLLVSIPVSAFATVTAYRTLEQLASEPVRVV